MERALAWDVAGTRHALQTTDFTDDELNEVICGCILKATGCPQWQGTDWQPYKLLVQQLTWSYAHLPGPSQQQLQVLQELMQYVPFTYHQELGASAHDLAAASGCVQLLRVLLQQPPSITTARIGIQQDWEGSLPLELPQMALVRSLTDNSRTVMVPRAVRWPGQTWVKEEASHLQWPGSVVLAAASGSAEAVYAYLNAGWTADGGYRGYYAGTYAGLVPIHWAAAVSLVIWCLTAGYINLLPCWCCWCGHLASWTCPTVSHDNCVAMAGTMMQASSSVEFCQSTSRKCQNPQAPLHVSYMHRIAMTCCWMMLDIVANMLIWLAAFMPAHVSNPLNGALLLRLVLPACLPACLQCLAPEVVEVLLHYGADPCEVFPPSGQTPLHLAAAPTDWKGTGQAWRALTQVWGRQGYVHA